MAAYGNLMKVGFLFWNSSDFFERVGSIPQLHDDLGGASP
jgi:hypothetical protein